MIREILPASNLRNPRQQLTIPVALLEILRRWTGTEKPCRRIQNVIDSSGRRLKKMLKTKITVPLSPIWQRSSHKDLKWTPARCFSPAPVTTNHITSQMLAAIKAQREAVTEVPCEPLTQKPPSQRNPTVTNTKESGTLLSPGGISRCPRLEARFHQPWVFARTERRWPSGFIYSAGVESKHVLGEVQFQLPQQASEHTNKQKNSIPQC